MALVFTTALALGCGARSPLKLADAGADGASSCVSARDCPIPDPCFRAQCDSVGRCLYEPVPLSFATEHRNLGTPIDVVRVNDHATVLISGARDRMTQLTDVFLADFDKDGPIGPLRKIASIPGNRVWDSRIARQGNEIRILTPIDGDGNPRMELRSETSPDVSSLDGAGIYPELVTVGDRLVASFDTGGNCMFAWVDANARWAQPAAVMIPGCANAQLPFGLGMPPRLRPTLFAREPISFFAIDSQGSASRFDVDQTGLVSTVPLSLNIPSSPSTHSFITASGEGRIAAMWIDVASRNATEVGVNTVVFDPTTLRPFSTIRRTMVPTRDALGDPYVKRMDLEFCSGRFIATWLDTRGAMALELALDGSVLSGPLRMRDTTTAGVHIRTACVPGGIVQVHYTGVTTVQCTTR